jgi:DNA-binding MarR family transcriptional regulator/polyhydroxyalkanoate synthesis regulator phasin
MEITLLILFIILFCVTSIFLLISFKRLKDATLEYERARRLIDDIVFSFKKDIQRQEERIQEIAKNIEELSIKREKEIEELNYAIADIRSKLENLSNYRDSLSADYENLKNKVDDLVAKYKEILEMVGKIEKIISEEKSETRREIKIGENEARSSISMKENITLASLNETELKVLEILAREGEKTVPEIREKIKLTREHTARLLKSLYARGFLERRDDRIPFVYRLNKKMEEILKSEKLKT